MIIPRNKLMEKYHNARKSAKERNIEWQFTFDTWLAWWGEDIVNRGRNKGQLCMARYKDQGPYHPNNVRKATSTENTIEGHLGKTNPNLIGNKHSAKPIQTPLGRFEGRASAARAYNICPTNIGYRIKKYPEQYYYIKEQV